MERSPSPELVDDVGHTDEDGSDAFEIGEHEAEVLLDLAETAIRARLAGRPAPGIDLVDLPPALHRSIGAFVTLVVAGELNGCVGDITGSASLAVSVTELAIRAAFDDPRLPALREADLPSLSIEVSLLSAQVEVPARSRAELVQALRRNEHGLIIRSGVRRALFLPSVWRQLPQPERFVDQLLHKSGLPLHAWPDDLVAAVFTTSTVHRRLG